MLHTGRKGRPEVSQVHRSHPLRTVSAMESIRIDRVHVQLRSWPRDMRSVRRSAFGERSLPIMLCQVPCWIVRASAGRRLIGYAWAYEFSSDRLYALIDDVAVRKKHQSQGIGGAMIKDLISWLRAEGMINITGYPTDPRMARIFGRYGVPTNLRPEFE